MRVVTKNYIVQMRVVFEIEVCPINTSLRVVWPFTNWLTMTQCRLLDLSIINRAIIHFQQVWSSSGSSNFIPQVILHILVEHLKHHVVRSWSTRKGWR